MDRRQLMAFAQTAARFAKQEIEPMVGTETRDGDLSALPEILAKADRAGLLADTNPDSVGFDYGVWGRATVEEGSVFSLAVLQQLARACAGVAACIHFHGLGTLLATEIPEAEGPAAVALLDRNWRLTWEAIASPPDLCATLSPKNGGLQLNGATGYVQKPPGCKGFVVYASGDSGWQPVFVREDAEGLTVTQPGERIGLSALPFVDLSFENVPIQSIHLLVPRDPSTFIRRMLLGLCAIAVGNARAAIDIAKDYARQRYQGGATIDAHAAVRILLGDSASRVDACESYLNQVVATEADNNATLWRAFAAKLRITTECAQAVTDCLQVLGGYGYMEDYRLEKRLRDAMTLKALALRPDDLRMLCATNIPEGDG